MHRLFFVLITLISTSTYGVELADLYQSQFPVSTQSELERQQVAPEVLRQVILKVVGDRGALDLIDLSPVLTQTEQLIQQYQYRRTTRISDDLTKPDQLELVLKFNEQSLNKSLTNLGLPVWSKSRPEVLLWLAVDDGENRVILSADQQDNSVSVGVKQSASRRGLPVLMPVMDLQDQTQVSFADLWAGFPEAVIQASQRYDAKVILMARISVANNGATQVHWQSLINGQSEEQWQSRGDLQAALDSGVDELTDRLARRFTQVVTSQYGQQYSLNIDNVRDYADYSRVTKYLSNLQYVSDIQVSTIADEQIELIVTLKGDLTVFNSTLALDQILIEDNSYSTTDTLRYRLSQ